MNTIILNKDGLTLEVLAKEVKVKNQTFYEYKGILYGDKFLKKETIKEIEVIDKPKKIKKTDV